MAWTVAALVIVINGYLLLDFFMAEVDGVLFGFLICVGTTLYVAFIFYLVSHGGALSSIWFSLVTTKRFAFIGI